MLSKFNSIDSYRLKCIFTYIYICSPWFTTVPLTTVQSYASNEKNDLHPVLTLTTVITSLWHVIKIRLLGNWHVNSWQQLQCPGVTWSWFTFTMFPVTIDKQSQWGKLDSLYNHGDSHMNTARKFVKVGTTHLMTALLCNKFQSWLCS